MEKIDQKSTSNKTLVTAGIVGIAAAAVCGIVALIVGKRETKKLSEAKAAEDETAVALGLSPKRFREQVLESDNEEDRNVVKATFVAIESSPNWDPEVLNVDKALEAPALLHVLEGWGRGSDDRGRRVISLLFEIPDYSKDRGQYNLLRVGDYFSALKSLMDYIYRSIMKGFCRTPNGEKVIYLAYSFVNPMCKSDDDNDAIISEYVEVPRNIYSAWAQDHDGLVEFNEDCENHPDPRGGQNIIKVFEEKKMSDQLVQLLGNDIKRKYPEINLSEIGGVEPDFVQLMYRMDFVEERTEGNGEYCVGMSIKTLRDSLRYIHDEFIIARRGRDEKETENLRKKHGTKYTNFLFHAPNANGEFDSLTRYYMADGKRNIVSQTYAFPKKEEVED